MKVSNKYVYMVVFKALLEYASIKELAKATIKAINADCDGAVELQDTRSDGFILRRTGDASITDARLYDYLAEATKDILNENSGEVIDYLSDNYEVPYDPNKIDAKFAQEIFDITRNGRLIYVESDM